MKYNLSKIMKSAWEMHRSYSCRKLTFGECLKRAWENAKEEMEEAKAIASLSGRKFEDGMEITVCGYTCILSRWTKYNNDRVYLNCKSSRSRIGYVDLKDMTDCTSVFWSHKMAAAIMTMTF